MPRTSTAERVGSVRPVCEQPLARDVDGRGWVRHTRPPDVDRLLGDDTKRAMMTDEDVEYLSFQGLCPFERGEKDENTLRSGFHPYKLRPRFDRISAVSSESF